MTEPAWIEEPDNAKRSGKDSVFTDLFHIPHYAWEMVNSLRPDLEAKESDIEFVSLRSVLMIHPYNDLGLLVKDKLFLCVEAQAAWSINILVRMLIYLAETYHKYIQAHEEINLYGTQKIILPEPDCYVIYTGQGKDYPKEISLVNEFFSKKSPLELKIKVLTEPSKRDIVGQYIRFCHIFDEQVKKYGRGKKAVEETIKIAASEGVLESYLLNRRVEVEGIMTTLFSQEEVNKRFGYECAEKGRKEGRLENILNNVRSLISKTGWQANKAMDMLDVPIKERPGILAQL